MNAATLSGPISRIFCSSERAHAQAELFGRLVAAVLVPVRLLDVDDARDRQPALRMHERHAAQARAGHRAAVVAR